MTDQAAQKEVIAEKACEALLDPHDRRSTKDIILSVIEESLALQPPDAFVRYERELD